MNVRGAIRSCYIISFIRVLGEWEDVLVIRRSLLVLQAEAGSGMLMRGFALVMVLGMPSSFLPLKS